jgi:hypothetical protein
MMSHDGWLVDSMRAIDFVMLNDVWTLRESENERRVVANSAWRGIQRPVTNLNKHERTLALENNSSQSSLSLSVKCYCISWLKSIYIDETITPDNWSLIIVKSMILQTSKVLTDDLFHSSVSAVSRYS